jgi:hypothetical protein
LQLDLLQQHLTNVFLHIENDELDLLALQLRLFYKLWQLADAKDVMADVANCKSGRRFPVLTPNMKVKLDLIDYFAHVWVFHSLRDHLLDCYIHTTFMLKRSCKT